LEIPFLRLDGSTPISIRQELIDKFNKNNKIPIFILSTKAGGLGINLTSADTVIMHDLDFNPENDRQAEDRCHRIGQTKAVKVYKLVCNDSVDEDIYDMTERKTQLSTSIFENENPKDNGKADDNFDVGSIQNILMKTVQKFANNAIMI
jgi:SWI/SNF-related matrix-associated actin-dependent regulator 1 of chromatin subfamily A